MRCKIASRPALVAEAGRALKRDSEWSEVEWSGVR